MDSKGRKVIVCDNGTGVCICISHVQTNALNNRIKSISPLGGQSQGKLMTHIRRFSIQRGVNAAGVALCKVASSK